MKSVLFLLSMVAMVAPVQKPTLAPVVFSKQILPILQRECVACHTGSNASGGYNVTSKEQLLKGGRRGVPILPGKGQESLLTKYLLGTAQPQMPPGKPLDRETIDLVRRWIDEGARVDTFDVKASPTSAKRSSSDAPAGKPSSRRFSAPVTALSVSPDGKWIAASGYRSVRVLDAGTGIVFQTLTGPSDQVQAVAWSPDSKRLAVGGGVPGQTGELAVYDVATGQSVMTLSGHGEVVVALAWRPNSNELASGSLDKTIRVYDFASGKELRLIKDHVDAVYSVAYSADGRYFASGSADRTAKVWDTNGWRRIASLTAHTEAVSKVAFHPNNTLLMTAGADKMVRIWQIKPGEMNNPVRQLGQGDVINAVGFSPDGNLVAWGTAQNRVIVHNGDASQFKQELKQPEDWVYALEFSKDSQTLVASTQDGRIYFWATRDWKLIRVLEPTGATK